MLGGIIPALMTWKQPEENQDSLSPNQRLVSGGKLTLIVMIAVALAVIIRQMLSIDGR